MEMDYRGRLYKKVIKVSGRLMPGSGLKLPLKHLNGHKTFGNPYFAGKLTVLNHSGQSLTLQHLRFPWQHFM